MAKLSSENRDELPKREFRSNVAERAKHRERKKVGRPPQPDGDLVAEITAVVAELPTYGYRVAEAVVRTIKRD